MPEGIAVFIWDQKIGSILDLKYPERFDISNSLTQKIYMSHAFNEDFNKEELLEVTFNNQTIISYCDKNRVAQVGYEVIVIVIEDIEKENIYKLKQDLLDFGKALFSKHREERKRFFYDNMDKFFQKRTAQKILLLGRAGTGKSTIKEIIFEGKDPRKLLYNPLEPTRGITPSVYSWLDAKLGLFDTSGQEIEDLLNDETMEQTLAFENTDIVIYLFDVSLWNSQKKMIFTDIEKIRNIIKNQNNKVEFILFLHKIDLIEENKRDNVLQEIKKDFNGLIYFTSIYPKLIYNLYNAFYSIISNFSEDSFEIKKILDEFFINNPKSMCYITNNNNSIMIQSMSRDFNTILINHIHKMITQITQSFENMVLNDNIAHLIISSSKSINTILNYLNLQKFSIKNLILISESMDANKLIILMGKIRRKINDYYYLRKKSK